MSVFDLTPPGPQPLAEEAADDLLDEALALLELALLDELLDLLDAVAAKLNRRSSRDSINRKIS